MKNEQPTRTVGTQCWIWLPTAELQEKEEARARADVMGRADFDVECSCFAVIVGPTLPECILFLSDVGGELVVK